MTPTSQLGPSATGNGARRPNPTATPEWVNGWQSRYRACQVQWPRTSQARLPIWVSFCNHPDVCLPQACLLRIEGGATVVSGTPVSTRTAG